MALPQLPSPTLAPPCKEWLRGNKAGEAGGCFEVVQERWTALGRGDVGYSRDPGERETRGHAC